MELCQWGCCIAGVTFLKLALAKTAVTQPAKADPVITKPFTAGVAWNA